MEQSIVASVLSRLPCDASTKDKGEPGYFIQFLLRIRKGSTREETDE